MTTAAMARKSQSWDAREAKVESVAFLTTTLAMLLQAASIAWTGLDGAWPRPLLIFVGPILMILILLAINIVRSSKIPIETTLPLPMGPGAFLQLSVFVIGILILSHWAQTMVGPRGLLGMTFIASLFELHGTVMANVELHSSGAVEEGLLVGLFGLSVVASCLSKLFLVFTLGNTYLKKKVALWTAAIVVTQFINWVWIA